MTAATQQESDRFGAFGGRYVPETLIPALDELEAAYATAQADPSFRDELSTMLSTYVGRPSPLSDAPRSLIVIPPRACRRSCRSRI